MDGLWPIALLGQEEPSLWRLLMPLVTIIGIVIFGWLNEKAKQKERQQQAQEEAQRRREDQQGVRRARTSTPAASSPAQKPSRPARTDQIHRYQPKMPGAAEQAEKRPQLEEKELVIVAEDVSSEAAQRRFQQEQQRLRGEAIRRARALQARRMAAQEVRAPAKPALKPLRTKKVKRPPEELIRAPSQISEPAVGLIRPESPVRPQQLRRAIIWSEILSHPRALRPLEQIF